MQLLKFLFGIILAQLATFLLLLVPPEHWDTISILRLALPLLFIALGISLWFNSMVGYHKKDALSKVKGEFAKEREEIKVNAEREKLQVEKDAQKKIVREATTTHAKANFKVGMAFAGVLGVGVLFVLAQMVTVGLLAISATTGALGGYYWRGKRLSGKKERPVELENITDIKVIESKPSRLKLFK